METKLQIPKLPVWNDLTLHSTELLRLVRRLRSLPGGRFRLILLEWNAQQDRQVALDHLDAVFAESCQFMLTASSPADFASLLSGLSEKSRQYSIVHILGFEDWRLAHDDVFLQLNYRREAIAAACPCAILLWLTPPDMKRLALEAPDLWAWRSAVLDFTRTPELQPAQVLRPERVIPGRIAAPGLEERLEQIETYLAERTPEVRLAAGLHREAGEILRNLGRWAAARDHLQVAYRKFIEAGDIRSAAHAQRVEAAMVYLQGHPDLAKQILEDQTLPVFQQLGDDRSVALTYGQIADILAAQGQIEESLRIRREEELPVYDRFGDVRSRAVTFGQIADILAAQGQIDEALRILREESLPVFDRLGDVRERAVTLSKIADVLAAQGQIEEALRILREELLPVFDRLGDVRERAVTLGKIADILAGQGQIEEALRILREELLPVSDRLGDVRLRAVALGKIADILADQGQIEEALRIHREQELPVYERLGDVRLRAVTLGQIADLLAAQGQIEEALQILNEDQLPVYERLGDVRSRAVTLRKVADILAGKGQILDSLALLNQAVSLLEPLGAIRDIAVFRGRIANILGANGRADEALRIFREEVLPIYERLGDVRELLVARTQAALLMLHRRKSGDISAAHEHLLWSYQAARQRGYKEAGQIAGILQQIGVPVPE